mgnify:CR=1 FL=1
MNKPIIDIIQRMMLKKLLKDIYIADPQVFHSLNGKQTKIIIRLLDTILVSNENDSIFEVLEGVLDFFI